MKFTKVRLENLFAYDGNVNFDFSDTRPERNIVLIWGRNGMGKTSFLNSMKLLFTGTTQSDFRAVGFPPVYLNLRQYVLGDGTRWAGIINRSARRRAEKMGRPLDGRVEASWENAEGKIFTATRWWSVDGDDVEEGVHVDQGAERIAGEAAVDFLAETLPADFVKFFFFDGEDIKSIAESSGSHQKDIDRLLQITFVEELAGELKKMVGDRRQRNLQSDLRRKMDDLKAEKQKAITAEIEADETITELDSQLISDGIELKKLQLRRANLSSGASELQREALEKQKEHLTERLKMLTEEIVHGLFDHIPVLANMSMVKQVFGQVDARVAAGASWESTFVRSISSQLPAWIEEADQSVNADVAERIGSYISTKMTETLRVTQPSGLFATSDILKMEKLRKALEFWVVAGLEKRELQAKLLLDASQVKAELQEVDEALLTIEVGAKGNLEDFRSVTNKLAELEEAIARQNQDRGGLLIRLEEARERQKEHEAKIKEFEAKYLQAEQDTEDGKYLAKVAQTLNQIAEELKKATRTELEDMLTDRFRRVITHPLIDRISLDDTYTMTYHEKSGRSIGRTSLSSGMKQLAATAMLWAMKDCAGRMIPVIIDTPLGRIDRENQDHLLTAYYPSLSHQVIILPTNAEIDSRKRSLLEARIAKHYTIINDSGDSANVEERPLVELS
mgnify:CR=1 FL=1|tara:strand:+ start:5829 stop:7859 length:2031 start_codon:yes stop_codon:yes gene_type:complete